MKLLKKFIKKAIAQDSLPPKAEYPVNFYKPKKDAGFLGYIARKNPFAYYLLQTQTPNEIIKEDPLSVRIGRLLTGSRTRKTDPNTGALSNNDFGIARNRNYYDTDPRAQALSSLMLRKEINSLRRKHEDE